MPCIIYGDFESLIKKINRYSSNPENFLTTKIGEYIPFKHFSTICAFVNIEKYHTIHSGKFHLKSSFCSQDI